MGEIFRWKAKLEGECSEVGMYLAMARVAEREGYPEIAALTLKVCTQTVNDLLRHSLSLADADHMLGHIGVAGLFDKCGCRSLADRALLRDRAFSDITTDGANILFHKNILHCFSL